jgi:hypothetical protein
MTARLSAWGSILLFSLLHLLLSVFFLAVATHETLIYGGSSRSMLVAFWVIAFPLAVADRGGLDLPPVWYLPNAMLYGLLWWAAWRMYQVTFRSGSKREG